MQRLYVSLMFRLCFLGYIVMRLAKKSMVSLGEGDRFLLSFKIFPEQRIVLVEMGLRYPGILSLQQNKP